ncbi:hypothetical protein Q4I28_006893 [Leishmania naiffi]|uniref:Uncharacterized protein n=2 Tax=Leishmania naiffi TaxID=5678 RepID=A0AAW3B9P8_9TRYP
MVYHTPTRHAVVRGARPLGRAGAKGSIPISPTVDVRGVSYVRPDGLAQHGCRRHGGSTANCTIESSRLRCEASPGDVMVCGGGAGSPRALTCSCPASSLGTSSVHLARFLLPPRQARPPSPSSRTLDAARLDRGVQSAQARVAPTVRHACEGRT